jgi:hypothetical protein
MYSIDWHGETNAQVLRWRQRRLSDSLHLRADALSKALVYKGSSVVSFFRLLWLSLEETMAGE